MAEIADRGDLSLCPIEQHHIADGAVISRPKASISRLPSAMPAPVLSPPKGAAASQDGRDRAKDAVPIKYFPDGILRPLAGVLDLSGTPPARR
jgi:hypothetical protein